MIRDVQYFAVFILAPCLALVAGLAATKFLPAANAKAASGKIFEYSSHINFVRTMLFWYRGLTLQNLGLVWQAVMRNIIMSCSANMIFLLFIYFFSRGN